MKGARFPIDILATRDAACLAVADEVGPRIRAGSVLGLPTDSTPMPLFREWIRRHRKEGLSFRGVTSFSTDEYEGLGRGDPGSRLGFMNGHLFSKARFGRNLVPSGLYRSAEEEAAAYERQIKAAGGIDWQLVVVGQGGRLCLNEPGSAGDSRTRRVTLTDETRKEAAAEFGGIDKVPTHAMTMGIRTILGARRIVVIGWGSEKAALIRQALSGPVTETFPASFLQLHENVRVILAEVEGDWS